MAINSKSKGSAFERSICVQLSNWVSHGERNDLYWRSAMSGGRATVAKKSGKLLAAQAGDISSVHTDGHVLTSDFYFELKHVKDLALDRFIVTGTGPLATFWQTAVKEARAYNKKPIMIVKQNRMPTLLLCSNGVLAELHRPVPSGPIRLATFRTGSRTWVALWLFNDVLKLPFERQATF